MKIHNPNAGFMLGKVSTGFLICFVAAVVWAEQPRANPTQPVYGARNIAGELQFNPEWVEPLRLMLKGVDSIVVTDKPGTRRLDQRLPEEIRGDKAQQMIGALAVIVKDGTISLKPDDARTLVVSTDQQSVAIAEVVLPEVLKRLELGQKEGVSDDAPQFVANLQGRWLLENAEPDNVIRDGAHPLLGKLASRHVASISGKLLHLSDDKVPHERRERFAININTAADPVQIDFDLEKDERVRGLVWMSGDQMLLVFLDGQQRPSSLKEAPGKLRLTYRRDETDPAFLRNHMNQLRDLAISHLMYDSVAGFQNARPFLDWSMHREHEAELRERSEAFAIAAAKHEAAGQAAEAKKARAEAESWFALAEVENAQFLESTRRQSEMRRLQSRARQLVQRIVYLQSERQHAEAQELQIQLDQLLRENDTDNWRIYDLQGRSTVARLEGKHELAERLNREADALRVKISKRYPAASADDEPATIVLKVNPKHISEVTNIETVLNQLGMLDEQLSVAVVESERTIILRGAATRVENAARVIQTLDAKTPETESLVTTPRQTDAVDATANVQAEAEYTRSLNELDSLRKQLGKQHPRVQDFAAILNARYVFFGIGQLIPDVIDWSGVISRQKNRLREAEQTMNASVTAYRNATRDDATDQQQARRDVQSAVRNAFQQRLALQVMQLQKSRHDLDIAWRRLRQRQQLNQRIIDRQVHQLTKPATVEAPETR